MLPFLAWLTVVSVAVTGASRVVRFEPVGMVALLGGAG